MTSLLAAAAVFNQSFLNFDFGPGICSGIQSQFSGSPHHVVVHSPLQCQLLRNSLQSESTPKTLQKKFTRTTETRKKSTRRKTEGLPGDLGYQQVSSSGNKTNLL